MRSIRNIRFFFGAVTLFPVGLVNWPASCLWALADFCLDKDFNWKQQSQARGARTSYLHSSNWNNPHQEFLLEFDKTINQK